MASENFGKSLFFSSFNNIKKTIDDVALGSGVTFKFARQVD